MSVDLRWQFDLAWALAEVHLGTLTETDMLWQPAPLCWTVAPDATGVWRADFSDTEPDPIPVPTIGWLTWHIDLWWSAAIAAVHGEPAPETVWAGTGSAAVARIRELATQWREMLDGLTPADLTRPSAYPWGVDAGHTVAHTAAWVNVELTKNIAEIGQLRLIQRAR